MVAPSATSAAIPPPVAAIPAATTPGEDATQAIPSAVPIPQATETGPAPANQPLQLVLALNVNGAGLTRFALAVSTPGSPQHARYEPIATLARRFGLSLAAKRRLIALLGRAGATDVSIDATGVFANATLTIALAERLFATKLAQFRSASAARFVAPTSAVTIPRALAGLVTGVVGLDTRPLASLSTAPGRDDRPLASLSTAPGGDDRQPDPELVQTPGASVAGHSPSPVPTTSTGPDPGLGSGYFPATGTQTGCAAARATGGFTPNQYLSAYSYDGLHNAGIRGQGETVALIEVDGFKRSDIRAFARCFHLRVPPIDSIGVGIEPTLPPGGESTLDLELLDAAAPRLQAIDVYEGNAAAAGTMRALTAPLQNPSLKPQVVSASLGLCESVTEQAMGTAGIAATEQALAEAAASGITFLASSGDSGSSDCTHNGSPIGRLGVNYPASSWWVTSVGGTNLLLDRSNSIEAQQVWNDGEAVPGAAAGGGASLLLKRPPYQREAVDAPTRAVPDVAMLADVDPGYAVFCSVAGDCVNRQDPDPWQPVGGTSAATPLLAGGLALVDQVLRERDRAGLGLANPLLYQLGASPAARAQAFSDVTTGNNDVGPFIAGNGASLGCCTAHLGYDEASGWGSVNLAGLAHAAVQAQPRITPFVVAGGDEGVAVTALGRRPR